LDNLRIQQVTLHFARAGGEAFEVSVFALLFAPEKPSGELGGGGSSVDGIIGTRRGNAGSWMSMIGKPPVGLWKLELPNTEATRTWFAKDRILDILLVVTYSGETPPWPT
jgi:hypothetical protein